MRGNEPVEIFSKPYISAVSKNTREVESQKETSPRALTEKLSNGLAFEMAYVEGGVFSMGSADEHAFYDEQPIHDVKLDSFYIGKYPVSQAMWNGIMSDGPALSNGDARPVEMVSWEDVQVFIQKLNEVTGKPYRLPTEAEWEYAARGGQQGHGYKYAGSNKLEEVGWYVRNSDGGKKPVGRKKPNELGIYGLSGNVLEWCQDWYSGDYYEACRKQGVVENPQGPSEGAFRVLRGGSWYLEALRCRSTYRHYDPPGSRFTDMGFRLALPVKGPVKNNFPI